MYKMINNRFSILLAERMLKITTVAKNIGASRTTLTNLYYKRTSQISIELLDKLCCYLDCNVNDILEFKEIDGYGKIRNIQK